VRPDRCEPGMTVGRLFTDLPPLVLLVDGDAGTRLAIAHLLLDEGYEVVEADHAGEAMSVLGGRNDFDVLIFVAGPEGRSDGPVLAQHALRSRPGLRIVFVDDEPPDNREPIGADEIVVARETYADDLPAALTRALAGGAEPGGA
jgi:two-component system, cell cycle response regulator CpdR